MMKEESGKIFFFRRKPTQAQPFLVYVEDRGQTYCMPFEELDEALDYMDEKEEDLGASCCLFQQIITEED